MTILSDNQMTIRTDNQMSIPTVNYGNQRSYSHSLMSIKPDREMTKRFGSYITLQPYTEIVERSDRQITFII